MKGYKIFLITGVLFICVSCVSTELTVSSPHVLSPQPPTETLEQVVLPTNTPLPMPTNTFPPPPSRFDPLPTLTVGQRQAFIEAVLNLDCMLPCFLGISPGETPFAEAHSLLITFGATYPAIEPRVYENEIVISVHRYALGINNTDIRATDSIELYEVNNTVVALSAFIGAGQHEADYDNWSRYSAKGMFASLGVPEAIYVLALGYGNDTLGNNLLLEYEQQGLWVKITGTPREDTLICPMVRVEGSLHIRASDRAYKNSLDALNRGIDYRRQVDKWGIWMTVEEALGISVQEFVFRALTEENPCFQRLEQTELAPLFGTNIISLVSFHFL